VQAEKKKSGYRPENAFACQDDDETVLLERVRVLRIFAQMSSSSGNKCKVFMNRDLNAAINIRQCVLLKTRLE